MQTEKISEMRIEYNAHEYLLELSSDGNKHYGVIHVNDIMLIQFTRDQRKSIQRDVTDIMNEILPKKNID